MSAYSTHSGQAYHSGAHDTADLTLADRQGATEGFTGGDDDEDDDYVRPATFTFGGVTIRNHGARPAATGEGVEEGEEGEEGEKAEEGEEWEGGDSEEGSYEEGGSDGESEEEDEDEEAEEDE